MCVASNRWSAVISDAVIVLTPWFPNSPGDREGNYVYESARAISRSGWRVSVLVSRPYGAGGVARILHGGSSATPKARTFEEFAEISVVKHLSVPRNLTPRISDAVLDRFVVPSLTTMVAQSGARLIHVHTEALAPAAVAVGRAMGAKVVVTLHGINVAARYFDHPTRRSRFQRTLSSADRVILVGEPLRPFFRDLVGNDDRFRVVPNGYSSRPVERSRPLLATGGTIRFVSVSNLHEGKGLDLNLSALAQLKRGGQSNWTYTLIGDGHQRSHLEKLVRASGLSGQVELTGALPPEEIPRQLAGADVFTLPSYREAFGIAYLEAMDAGLLVVGVQDQGAAAFIEHGVSGLLMPPRDADALAQQFSAILRNPSSFRAMAANGRRVAREGYSWEKHAIEVKAVYQEALAAHQ